MSSRLLGDGCLLLFVALVSFLCTSAGLSIFMKLVLSESDSQQSLGVTLGRKGPRENPIGFRDFPKLF